MQVIPLLDSLVKCSTSDPPMSAVLREMSLAIYNWCTDEYTFVDQLWDVLEHFITSSLTLSGERDGDHISNL